MPVGTGREEVVVFFPVIEHLIQSIHLVSQLCSILREEVAREQKKNSG